MSPLHFASPSNVTPQPKEICGEKYEISLKSEKVLYNCNSKTQVHYYPFPLRHRNLFHGLFNSRIPDSSVALWQVVLSMAFYFCRQ